MRPTGPSSTAESRYSRNARIFTETITRSGLIKNRVTHRFLLISSAAIALSIVIPVSNVAYAEPRTNWSFHSATQVRWSDVVLPPGDYAFSVSGDDHRLVTVFHMSGDFVATIAAQAVTSESGSGPTLVFTRDDGDGNYVVSVYISDIGSMLTFAQPNTKTQTTAASGDSALPASSLFAIHNSTNHTVPYAQAEALYLSACKVVEREFGQPGAVRPRLTLIVGAEVNGVDFPKHEIQLKKWNSYSFAQGVVLLAVDDLLPLEKRISLTRLAVTEAESTVALGALKNEPSRGEASPQN